ncbi:hypothetical protein LguiB_013197 [Lonicera macranthoides]
MCKAHVKLSFPKDPRAKPTFPVDPSLQKSNMADLKTEHLHINKCSILKGGINESKSKKKM